METCFVCGGPMMTINLLMSKCIICGQYREIPPEGGPSRPPRLNVYPYVEQVRQAAIEGVEEVSTAVASESAIPRDMVIFIRRIAEALTPLKGYERDRAFKTRALKVREQFKRDLTRVFEGKTKFQSWYDKTRTGLGMHSSKLDGIIYEALSGLDSEEATAMRMDWERKLQGGPLG